jgi:hypothetical protein
MDKCFTSDNLFTFAYVVAQAIAHQAAFDEVQRLIEAGADERTVSAAVDDEDDRKRGLAEDPCGGYEGFFITAAQLYRTDVRAFGEPDHGNAFGSLAILVKAYLEQRAA